MSFIDILADQLIEHESLRLAVYDDATGKPIEKGDTLQGHPTIGVGRLLTSDRGISHEEAKSLLMNDLKWVAEKAEGYGFWHKLDTARQMVIMNMIFNMGNRFDQFKKMHAALERGDYQEASVQMLDSVWAKQVKSRATHLAEQMREGVLK
jgi:lysozyme